MRTGRDRVLGGRDARSDRGGLDQDGSGPPSSARRPAWRALLAAARPRQWVKNLLVFAAPGTAGVLGRPVDLARCSAAFALFVAASAGTYLINDAIDADADRMHPVKRLRPIAAGELSRTTAVAWATVLLAGSLVAAPLVAGTMLAAVVAGYVGVTVSYSLWLKRVPFLELGCISIAFLLRALGGAAAVRVPVSPWFLVVTSAGALLVAAGKRGAEQDLLGAGGAAHRRALSAYPPWLLRAVRVLASVTAVAGYLLWALWRAAHTDHGPGDTDDIVFGISVLPFALGVATLETLLERGGGGAPEELAYRSRTLQGLGLACVVLVAVGIYS